MTNPYYLLTEFTVPVILMRERRSGFPELAHRHHAYLRLPPLPPVSDVHPMGKFDKWQILLFLLGQSDTGKSAVLDIASKLHLDGLVAVISSTFQKKFGAETGACLLIITSGFSFSITLVI